MTPREVSRVLRFKRIRHVVALAVIGRVEQQKGDIAASMRVGEAQGVASANDARPSGATGQDVCPQDQRGIKGRGLCRDCRACQGGEGF